MSKIKNRKVIPEFNKTFSLISKATDEGSQDIFDIEGIVSVEGVVDKTGEKLAIGAFDDQIGKTVSIMIMHEGVRSIIGDGTLIKGENNQILIKGKLYKDVEKAVAVAKNKAAGVVFNLSIGGKRLEWSWEETEEGDMILNTKKVMVREVSITGEDQQAHPDARITKNYIEPEEDEMTAEEIKKIVDQAIAKTNAATTSADVEKALAPLKDIQKALDELKANESEDIQKAIGDVAKVSETVKSLTETIQKMEELMQNTIGIPQTGDMKKMLEAQQAEFEKYLRADAREATEILKAIDTTGGGSLIPQLLANEIIKDVREFSPFFADAKIYSGGRSDIDIPIRDSWTNTTESVAEGSGVATRGEVTYSLLNIKAAKIQSEIELTDEMRDDTDFDMTMEIKEVATEDFAEELSSRIINGVISSNNQIEGFLQNTAVTTAALESSTVGTFTWDDLINLEMSLKTAERKDAKYYVSRDALTLMKKFKDQNDRPLWQPSLVPGAPSTFNGYPVIECPDMDTVANGNYPVLFANFKRFYAIYLRKGLETEFDRLAAQGKDLHITRMRVGGKVRKVTAGKLLKIKAV